VVKNGSKSKNGGGKWGILWWKKMVVFFKFGRWNAQNGKRWW
jgi:hypothetical protein